MSNQQLAAMNADLAELSNQIEQIASALDERTQIFKENDIVLSDSLANLYSVMTTINERLARLEKREYDRKQSFFGKLFFG